MVNVRQHDATAPVLDAAAEEQFQRDWRTYAKIVDHDYACHREAYGILHRVLADIPSPFQLLDLACGDARGVVGALRGTSVAHYHGVDLSRPALDMAARALEALDCPIELDQRDFIAAMADRPEPADVVWIGLSLHHLVTADKLTLMREVRGVVGRAGRFLIYEPTCGDGEDRADYLARFERVNRPLWAALTATEWAAILDHVTRCDMPESALGWTALGREAGFGQTQQLFAAPTDLYRLFAFHA
jgi:SAM-dependent methyltransferase